MSFFNELFGIVLVGYLIFTVLGLSKSSKGKGAAKKKPQPPLETNKKTEHKGKPSMEGTRVFRDLLAELEKGVQSPSATPKVTTPKVTTPKVSNPTESLEQLYVPTGEVLETQPIQREILESNKKDVIYPEGPSSSSAVKAQIEKQRKEDSKKRSSERRQVLKNRGRNFEAQNSLSEFSKGSESLYGSFYEEEEHPWLEGIILAEILDKPKALRK